MQSTRFSLNSNDWNTILTIVLHGLAGIVLMLITVVFAHINYGLYAAPVSMAFSVITAGLTAYMSGASKKDLEMQALRQTVDNLQRVIKDSAQSTVPV
jgi:FtsH-binding integral membrane protein